MIKLELLSKLVKTNAYHRFCVEKIPWNYKIKYLNGEKIIGSFYEKELLLSIYVIELLSRTRQSY